MILKTKKEEKNEVKDNKKTVIDLKKIFSKFKLTKKQLIKIIIIIIAIILSILLIKELTKKVNITIDIASTNVAYTYGPNTSTSSNVKVGEEIDMKIITDSKREVKCYSTNESVIQIMNNSKVKANQSGFAQIYCKIGNSKSNVIDVKVEE